MGTIFSIEEFSVYDGPGVRMSIFLKGCPLRCEWCHNPEGQSFEPQYIKSNNGCLHCNECIKAAMESSGKPVLCEKSAQACPQHLIRLCGKEYSPEEIVKTVAKNADLLNKMGGGVTFSGGEPLAQPDFLLRCLDGLKATVHRAVQTCGMAKSEIFTQMLSKTDYVLYDIKLMDSTLHKRYTGVDNKQILENYKLLVNSKVDFITRIPLIPNVNDTVQSITQTAAFLSSLNVNCVELLPYNKFAGSKYESVGKKYSPSFDEAATPNPHNEIWNNYEIEVTVL